MLKRYWKPLAGLLLLVLVAGGAYLVFGSPPSAQASSTQPIDFNHEIMVQSGIPCLYCHADARRSPQAGMPSVEKCMGCHLTISIGNPEVKKLTAYWQRGEPIPWVRINRLPRFVYFTHQPHIAADLDCETCHGDVGHMEVVQPAVKMSMGWCVGCHRQQPDAKKLTDCITCHQ